MRSLNSLSSFCPFVETIYVYSSRQQYVFSTSDHRAISNREENFLDEEAVEMLKNNTPQTLRTPIYRSGKYSSSSTNDHVYSYIMADSAGGAMMINISTDWLNSLLFSDGICACIINSNDNLVAHPSQYDAEYFPSAITKLPDKDEETEGYTVYSTKDGKKVLLYTNMDNRDWRYLRIEDYRDCLGSLLRVQRLSFAIFGIVALIGLSAGAVLLVQIVFPFQKLSNAMDSAGLKEENLTMEQLTEKLTNLLAATKNAEHIQESLRQMMKNEAVYNILFGNEEDYEDLIDQYGLQLSPDEPIIPLLISGIN